MKALPVEPRAGRVLIGARLRAARLAQSLTIDEVARMSGLNKGFISRIERDETSPSVASLVAVCQVLSVPVGRLFEEREHDLVTAESAVVVDLGTFGAEEHLLTPRGQPAVQVLRSRVEPLGHGGEQLYTMNCDVEILHVIKGVLEVRFPEREEIVRAGDTLTFAGREPHTWRNPQKARATLALWVISPAAWNV